MKKILVANRGEIALRVIRSIKECDLKSVAVFSEADRNAPFVKSADEAICIGPPPSKDSYLLIDKIIEVAKKHSVDAIHPGYGFLSENAEFANAVEEAGISFIGPPAKAIETMGDKLAAKAAVKEYGIPLLPGTDEPLNDINKAKAIAKDIGFPILIKAAAGGGGKGMRVVEEEKDLQEQLDRAISEAESAFGNGAVFIEKYISSPRHVEIQVLSDTHGNHLYLFERECSIQRRHQKVIEEAPCSVLSDELRQKMGESAVNAAKACNYVGAGTVEFLLDENKNFYFLEMNTRLQVEHPVTEMITGLDLVKEQIKIARGEAISFKQDDLKINGHAIELRIYAEDPVNNFLPDIGKLERYRPSEGPGIRVDGGFEEDMDIPVYYDPMLAKLVVHDEDRERAMDRMIRAIQEFEIQGVSNTLKFGEFVMKHQAFRTGDYDTHFVAKHFDPKAMEDFTEDEALVAGLVATAINRYEKKASEVQVAEQGNRNQGNWKRNRKHY